ncbi:uncharacterized protein LOC132749353 isoform X2 [Ruditapes philippinarum]|uniref:uncharacterized protein LOC132749353 isoform X2 n=1 Tax=Ruditapes philippinarum TaxID=129788 RepID=UPI00295A69E8|nr:uncharacterized protein LOC132749353 isoform X2 [Ruditapes philippinarum]
MEIQKMDQSSIQLYMKLLDEGYEDVYNIRVIVVGHKGAGKTTLTKRLLNEDVYIGKEESTNGIEVHVNRCKVALERGQWIISESDKNPTNAPSQRIVELLKQSATSTGSNLRKTDVKDDTIEEDPFENDGDKKPTNALIQRLVEPLKPSATSTGSNLRKTDVKDDTIEEGSLENGGANEKVVKDEEKAFTTNETKYSEIVKDLQDTLHEGRKMSTGDLKTADVSIWDFAGQTEFYDTHQVFLSKRAIYLLVTDMSKQVNDIVEDGNKNWKISEFADFWLTSIYEFCGTKDSDGPPVILVGTFADILKQESKEETIGTFFYNLRKCLIDYKATFNLLKKCISIDNSIKDDKIEELKQHIVEKASEQGYWGEHYPATWITLERSIVKLKDIGVKILKKDHLFAMNTKLPVPINQKDGLDLFLRFHHDSGNILYFSEEELSDTIVLDPQWLIDAFKSLITAQDFCSRQDPAIFQEWIKFGESAILKETLVEKIWDPKGNIEFHKHRHLLLKYLEKLGIIAKPHHLPGTSDVTDYYFAPCFLKQTPPDDLLSPKRLPENRMSTSKLCLTTELQFLHAHVFNKLLAACINKWQLSKKDGNYLVYRGCAIFDLEQNHTLYVYFFNHVIQIWLTKYSTKKEKPSQSVCLDVYTFILDRLTNCLNRSGNVKVLFKCSSSKHNSIENMFPIDELSKKSEVECKCTTEEHVFETKELTEYWLNAKMFQKSSCIFDGRLMLLQSHEIITLESSLDKEPIGQGRIGTVYCCNNQEIFGIPVAVKKIKTKSDPKIKSQVRREKIACRLMNPFILPLLAVVEKSKEEVWLISPYCENGDLHDAIASGKDQNNTDEININNQATRVKILLQIALAIQYIHTPVQNVRGPILHKDIASKNVVLDKYLNARLIDFGLAREKDDKSTIHGGRRTYDHPDVGDGKGAKEYYDYHSFGIIIREMLTSLEPEGDGHFLLKMDKDQIKGRIDTKVWKYKGVIQKLNDLSDNCLKCPWTIEEFEANVIDELRNIMETEVDCQIFENKEEINCHQCIINPIAKNSSLTDDYDNCRTKIRVCMACEKNSFLNPVICYCGAKLTSMIGSKWGALLVAGDDESQEKADAMKNEILEFERIVTSLAPRIIGISKCKVKTVVPGDTKMKTETGESQTWLKIKEHIKNFSEDKEIDTLLIYFSCHGGSSADGSMFELGKKSEYISLVEFQKELHKLHKIDRLILFLDRCFPPKVTLTNRKFVQINACSKNKKAVLNEEGSLFTKYVIQALKARSEERECSKDCEHCYSYWSSRTEYVSICSLYDYVNKHLELKAPQPDWKLESIWDNIAFFTDEVVEIEFTFHKEPSEDGGITIPLSLGYLKNIDEVKQKILLAFKDLLSVDRKTHKVKIRKDTFRNDQQADDECTTLEQVIEAWVQRFPLSVTFH